eukprot:7375386-Prymnesium_polylepis.1
MMFLGVLRHDLTRSTPARDGSLRWIFTLKQGSQEWARPGGAGPPPPCVWLEEELGKLGMNNVLAF